MSRTVTEGRDLVGREADVSALSAFIATARTVGGALAVTGGPGLGKSALMDAAVAQARALGVRVVALAGTNEGSLEPFAALNRLGAQLPVPGVLAEGKSGSRLGPISRPTGEPSLTAFTAALSAIRQASLTGPLLIAVDDAHWLDRPSAEVLAFAARRLGGSRTGVLVASRPSQDRPSVLSHLPARHLARLTDEAATHLLATRFPALSTEVRERLVSAAEGIPRALMGLGAALVGEQHDPATLPVALPMSARLQALFDSRIAWPPEETRRSAPIPALGSLGDLRLLHRVTGPHFQETLRKAKPGRLVAAHPSGGHAPLGPTRARSAFVHAASSGQLRRAHRGPVSDGATAGELLRTHTADACQAFDRGDLATAYETISDALERFGSAADGESLAQALDALQAACYIAGSDETWRRFGQTIAQLGSRAPAALRLLAQINERSVVPSCELLAKLDAAVDRLSAEDDTRVILPVAAAAVAADHGASCRFAVRQVLEDTSSDTVRSGMLAVCLLAEIDSAAGDTDWVRALVLGGLGETQSTEHLPYAMLLQSVLALSSAVTGDDATVRALTQQAMRWAEPARAHTVLRTAQWALGRQALGKPDHAAACRHFLAMADDDGLEALVDRQPAVLFDVVEAAVGSGLPDLAHACVARARTGVSTRRDLIARGARALVEQEDPAGAFEHAGALPAADRWPFELARIRLAYGEYLGRAGAADAAREQLSSALDAFRALGARPWIARAVRQLRVTGAAVVGIELPREPLTRQEERIADLAASGLTNRDIARSTQLSERTIASHLRQVFRKTGITSRAQLRDTLTARDRA